MIMKENDMMEQLADCDGSGDVKNIGLFSTALYTGSQDCEREHVYSIQYLGRRTCSCTPRCCTQSLDLQSNYECEGREHLCQCCVVKNNRCIEINRSRADEVYFKSQTSPLPLSFLSVLSTTLIHSSLLMITSQLLLSRLHSLSKSVFRFVLYAILLQNPSVVVNPFHRNKITLKSAQINATQMKRTYAYGASSDLHSRKNLCHKTKRPTLRIYSRPLVWRCLRPGIATAGNPKAGLIALCPRSGLFITLTLGLLAMLPLATTAYELKPTMTISRVTLAGGDAKLPCELPLPADRPTLILWYKDQSTKPFYSYDARETASGRHKIHDNSDLATRSRFSLEKFHKNKMPLGFLEVEGVTLADAGNYTCRVDFMTSQTMMALLKLTVHEEIRGLEVFDAYGTMISKIVGPHEQSTRVMLSCRAYGGFPSPVVQWMSGDEVLESSTEQSYAAPQTTLPGVRGSQPHRLVNVMLHLPGLQREDNGREIKCVAFNTNLSKPRSRVLTIQVYLPPLEVKVEGLEKPLLAGIESILLCRATGSRPPATLTWVLEGSSGLTPLPAQSSLDQNTTLRRGRLLPTPDDNGRTLSCIAENPKVEHYKTTDSKVLEVYFAPEVEAKLAPALDPENIKEGEDVYFECVIKANPAESRVLWLHEGKQLFTDLELGILAQGKNLVLQKVSRHARGNYQCRVTNTIDTVTSAPTSLNVMFIPECSGSRNVTVSVTPTEEVKLNCLVDSNPEAVDFIWKVNSSRGVKDLDPSSYTNQGHSSMLSYRPSAHAIANDQYGVVFCQGVNKLGTQKLPCMFVISPAGPPEELQSCSLRNQSATSLAVICEPGHDGGLKQHFIAMIKDAENGEMVENVSSETPRFSVGGLAPGRDYLVMVQAVNNKGSSEPYVLEGFALKVDEIKINNSNSSESSPLLAVFVGVVSGFALILMVLAAANRARGRRRRGETDNTTDNKLSTADEAPLSPSTNASLDDAGDRGHNNDDVTTPESRTPGSLVTPESPPPQTVGSPGSMASRTYVPGPAGHTGSLPRSHLHPRPQPLHSVDLPHITSNNHKYYTLKINCTRQNNESFV